MPQNTIPISMRPYIFLFSVCILFSQCKVNKNNLTTTNQGSKPNVHNISTSSKKVQIESYQPSAPHIHDLQHTWLNIKFDYTNQYVIGKALITFKTHFYASDSLHLDAQKFILKRVAKINGNDTINLKYNYDESVIHIALGKIYKGGETFKIFIDYTARPNDVDSKGSLAITDAKGLYFINPLGKEADKPRQSWSQGETQSNSCWCPTLDVPNQKMTQEIILTVDKKDVTLSNGELTMSKDNADGTRTDYWKQSLPHAPYLTMIAVGEFAIVKDYWRDNMEVNYYVEPSYKQFAKLVFGNTPEMLECFSTRLGVDYPWEKFSQIVVRDFVSGAMENTSAVVHFDLLQHDAREHLDNTYEDVISHELFHHWFGDYVTCESWSNVPLNESFATYGEYIWNEYKYGRLFADKELDDKLLNYLMGPQNYDRVPIRYKYHNREDMFDAVSYQKGGRILHMLRYVVGDSAFFKSLQTYLNDNKFSTVEIHNLRLAFEKVTGEDLNWFFNQWFLQPGHPKLNFTYHYSADRKQLNLDINQTQDTVKFGIYKLPIEVDVYDIQGKVKRSSIVINKTHQSFSFISDQPIALVNPDAEKVLLAVVDDNKSKNELTYQFIHAPLYADKWFALKSYTGNTDSTYAADSNLLVMADYALEHPFFGIRLLGLDILKGATKNQLRPYEFKLRELAKRDSSSKVRATVLDLLRQYDPMAFEVLFEEKLNDSSYTVFSSALTALYAANQTKALTFAKGYEQSKNGSVLSAISSIYASSVDTTIYTYFVPAMKKAGNYRYSILQDYWEYTMMQMPALQLVCLNDLYENVQLKETKGYEFYINMQLAKQMQKQTIDLSNALTVSLKKAKKGSQQETNIKSALEDLNKVNTKLDLFAMTINTRKK